MNWILNHWVILIRYQWVNNSRCVFLHWLLIIRSNGLNGWKLSQVFIQNYKLKIPTHVFYSQSLYKLGSYATLWPIESGSGSSVVVTSWQMGVSGGGESLVQCCFHLIVTVGGSSCNNFKIIMEMGLRWCWWWQSKWLGARAPGCVRSGCERWKNSERDLLDFCHWNMKIYLLFWR